MRCLAFTACFFILLCKANATEYAQNTILEVSLNQLHPTQPAIGYDQVYYKLELFNINANTLLDEYCQSNGQGELLKAARGANIHNSKSFTCSAAVGTYPEQMKTVVIGPQQQFYLTDGHHTFSSLWEHSSAGPQLKMFVRVSDDFSDSVDLPSFWARMQDANKVWLRSAQDTPITPRQIPSSLGFKSLENDPYRALVYFTRGAAYEKPHSGQTSTEYIEFYWGNWLRSQLDLNQYDLSNASTYRKAIEAAAELMVAAPEGTSLSHHGFTVRTLGGYGSIDRKKLNKTIAKKLPLAIAYKRRATL